MLPRAWQDLDWRFLLPRPLAGRIAVLGDVPGTDLIGELPGVDSIDTAPVGHDYDIALLGPDTPRARGLDLLGSPGIAYQQPRSARAHRTAGSGGARLWWHAPSRAATSYLAACDDRTAIRQLVDRHHGVPFGRAKAYAARALVEAGGVALLARHVSVVASPHPRAPLPCLAAQLSPGASVLHATPRFAASRHVVALVTPAGARHPRQVVKMPRRPGDTGGIEVEHDILAALATAAPGLRGRVPGDTRLHEMGGLTVLVETAVTGPPLDPARVRRDPARAREQALDFVERMPVTGSTGSDPTWFARLLDQPLRAFAARAPLGQASAALVQATRALLAPLATAQLPLVAVHGDLSHPNLVVAADGALCALDWERAQPTGLPGTDAVFVLQYLGEARRGVFDRPAQCRVLDQDLLERSGPGRVAVEQHLGRRGVDPALYPALLVACWARAALSLLDRLGDIDPHDRLAIVRADRDVILWQHAVSRLAAG